MRKEFGLRNREKLNDFLCGFFSNDGFGINVFKILLADKNLDPNHQCYNGRYKTAWEFAKENPKLSKIMPEIEELFKQREQSPSATFHSPKFEKQEKSNFK